MAMQRSLLRHINKQGAHCKRVSVRGSRAEAQRVQVSVLALDVSRPLRPNPYLRCRISTQPPLPLTLFPSQNNQQQELRDTSREGKYGHIAGVSVGDEFLGRGELAVLGLHSQIMPGIDARCVSRVYFFGCVCVCFVRVRGRVLDAGNCV